jgi:hypothetical protein
MATLTIGASLTHDPARFGDVLVVGVHDPYSCELAEREVRATCSSVYRGNKRVVARMNLQGRWSVLIGAQDTNTIHLEWSPLTMSDDSSGDYRLITRGEAVMTLCHEMFHILFTSETRRPTWCKPEHWQDFFSMVNMTEDVRIEDLGEAEVPLFAHLRAVENDRLLTANLVHYTKFDLIRKVSVPWFAKRACSAGSETRFTNLMDANVARIVNDLYADFDAATRAGSTGELVDLLRPVYEALAPLMDSNVANGTPDNTDDTGDGTSDGEPDSEQGSSSESGDGDEQGTDVPDSSGDESGDESSDTDGNEQDSDADSEADGSSSGGDADEDDDEDDDDSSNDSDGGSTGGNGDPLSEDKPMRPDNKRGDWSGEDKSATPPEGYMTPEVMSGGEVDRIGTRVRRRGTSYDRVPSVTPIARKITAQLRRVLQSNADGAFVGRRRRGAFDVSSATRIALGDTRIFRKKEGPRGALDFSLVLCLDASSSVTGFVGDCIANAGVAIHEAARRVDGLDVALCVYGSTVLRTTPFGWDRTDPGNAAKYTRMGSAIHGGEGGGTSEDAALVWARAATRQRNAQQGLIVVLTDGGPNSWRNVQDQVACARMEGVLTGGIGVGYPAPHYHQFSSSTMDINGLPMALTTLLRTMMKAR